jgi:CDP-diacylglycerol--glycerol-3-phosphate 3-phosphatidyltransferase
MNWAVAVTFFRIALVPVFLLLMYAGRERDIAAATAGAPWLALVVFAIAAVTDSLDGYLARRHQRVTSFGQFLDPLADKLLVGAALVTLVAFRDFPAWAAIVIVVREVAVSVLRIVAATRGRSVPANIVGKLKTAIQIPTVMIWLLPRSPEVAIVQDVILWLAVALTLISGAMYFARARELLAPREPAATGTGG